MTRKELVEKIEKADIEIKHKLEDMVDEYFEEMRYRYVYEGEVREQVEILVDDEEDHVNELYQNLFFGEEYELEEEEDEG